MRWLRSIVGVALTVVAGCAALLFVFADRVVAWRERRAAKKRAEEFRRKVQEARRLADAQRDAVVAAEVRRVNDQLQAEQGRDPVDLANEIIGRSRREK